MDLSVTVVASHAVFVPVGARTLEARVWVTAAGFGAAGADVALRLWTPCETTVVTLREARGADVSLTGAARKLDARTASYPAGRWQDGTREYELAVTLPSRAAGDQMLVARFEVAVDGDVVERALLTVTFYEDGADRAPTPKAPGTAAVALAERPTDPSPKRRQAAGAQLATAEQCSRCGAQTFHGDRFCEGCGAELIDGHGRSAP